MRASVLIPSFQRVGQLTRCLYSVAAQCRPADEVLVVWQGDDNATHDTARAVADRCTLNLRAVHSPQRGVVPAENVALASSTGDIVLLIDDDAIAPPDWIARHLRFYDDPTVGAVGGPAVNHRPDGTPFPLHPIEPVGRINLFGRPIGNMYDQPHDWRARGPIEVDHLVGYNMSVRRSAFERFEDGLREYWQMFEFDACMQVRSRRFRVLFDFSNVVDHYPTNSAYCGGRDGDLQIKIFNATFNHGFIVGKHIPGLMGLVARMYQYWIGTLQSPGALGALVGWHRFGDWRRERWVRRETWKSWLAGHQAGRERRRRSLVGRSA